MSTKVKLRLTQGAGFVASVAPLAVTVGINWDHYVATDKSPVGLTVGGLMLAFLIAMQMLGQARKVFGNGIVVSGFIFVLVCCLEPILMEAKLLSGMMLAGQGINVLAFQPVIRKLKTQAANEETAKVTTESMTAALEKFSGRV